MNILEKLGDKKAASILLIFAIIVLIITIVTVKNEKESILNNVINCAKDTDIFLYSLRGQDRITTIENADYAIRNGVIIELKELCN